MRKPTVAEIKRNTIALNPNFWNKEVWKFNGWKKIVIVVSPKGRVFLLLWSSQGARYTVKEYRNKKLYPSMAPSYPLKDLKDYIRKH